MITREKSITQLIDIVPSTNLGMIIWSRLWITTMQTEKLRTRLLKNLRTHYEKRFIDCNKISQKCRCHKEKTWSCGDPWLSTSSVERGHRVSDMLLSAIYLTWLSREFRYSLVVSNIWLSGNVQLSSIFIINIQTVM